MYIVFTIGSIHSMSEKKLQSYAFHNKIAKSQ